MKQPQEIEVWYVLPAIRRELAIALIKNCNLNQKQTAKVLGVAESAVSQYLKSKRAKEITFNQEILKQIKKSAKKISENKNLLLEEIQRICGIFRKKGLLCKIHRKYEKVPKECKVMEKYRKTERCI